MDQNNFWKSIVKFGLVIPRKITYFRESYVTKNRKRHLLRMSKINGEMTLSFILQMRMGLIFVTQNHFNDVIFGAHLSFYRFIYVEEVKKLKRQYRKINFDTSLHIPSVCGC